MTGIQRAVRVEQMAEHRIVNGSNATKCLEFSESQLLTANFLKTGIAIAALIACSIVIVVITILRGYKHFVYRLVLYLMVADLLQALTNILESLPVKTDRHGVVKVQPGTEGQCATYGFLNQLAAWSENVVICWIMAYILVLVARIARVNSEYQSVDGTKTGKLKHKKYEVFGVIFVALFPVTFNWIPFVDNMYGLSGMWCWIKLTKGNCHDDYIFGLTLTFLLLYAPLMLIALFGFVTSSIAVFVLCKQKIAQKMKSTQLLYNKGLQEMIPLLAYPLIFSIICSFSIANRIYYAEYVKPYYPLWIAHAAADPGRVLLPPIAFMLHPSTYKKLLCPREQGPITVTSCHISKEGDDIEKSLVLKGTPASKNYNSIFGMVASGNEYVIQ